MVTPRRTLDPTLDATELPAMVGKFLARLAESPVPFLKALSEQDFLQEILVLANASQEKPKRVRTAYVRLQFGAWDADQFALISPPDPQELRDLCQDAHEQLSAIADDWQAASRNLEIELVVRSCRVLVIPLAVEGADGSITVQELLLPRDTRAALDHANCLLIDPSRGWGSKLCVCRLQSCSRLFFEYRHSTGRPRRLYCCDEHMHEAHDAAGPARVAAHRASKRRRKSR